MAAMLLLLIANQRELDTFLTRGKRSSREGRKSVSSAIWRGRRPLLPGCSGSAPETSKLPIIFMAASGSSRHFFQSLRTATRTGSPKTRLLGLAPF